MGLIEGPGPDESRRQSDAERMDAIRTYQDIVEQQETWLAILAIHLLRTGTPKGSEVTRPWQLHIDRAYADAVAEALGLRPTVIATYDPVTDRYVLEIC